MASYAWLTLCVSTSEREERGVCQREYMALDVYWLSLSLLLFGGAGDAGGGGGGGGGGA